MKCINCGTKLSEDASTCPSCGALNMTFDHISKSMNEDENAVAVNMNTEAVVEDDSKEESAIPLSSTKTVVENESEESAVELDNTKKVEDEVGESAVENSTDENFKNGEIVIKDDSKEELSGRFKKKEKKEEKKEDPESNLNEMGVPIKKESNIFDEPTEEVEEEKEDEMDYFDNDISHKQVDENIAPPELDVENENLTKGVSDLGSSNDVSTYEKEPVEDENGNVIKEEDDDIDPEKVDIVIPKVVSPVDNSNVNADGSAPNMKARATVGHKTDESEFEENVVVGKKGFSLNFLHKKAVPTSLLILIIFAVLVVGCFLGSTLFSKNYCATNTTRISVSKKVVSDGKNNITKAGDFIFKIPEDYIFDKTDKGLLIYDKDSSWRIYVRNDIASYNNLADAAKSIRETLSTQGMKINEIKELKVSGNSYLTIEGTTKTTNRLIAFTDALHDNVFYVEIVDVKNSFNYELLDIANDILINAQYDEIDSEMEKISIYDIAEIAILSAEEYYSRIGR